MALAIAGVIAGLAAVHKLQARLPPGVEPPEPLLSEKAPEAAAPGERGRSSNDADRALAESPTPVPHAAASAPAPDSSAQAPAEPQRGPRAPSGPDAEPASCSLFSLSDIPSAPQRPSVSASWYEGASGFRRAAEEQSSSGAPLLMLFYVDWCPHCRRFISEVLPSSEMRELGDRIIKVKVNPETNGDDQELAKRFSVTGYPTLLLIATPGQSPVRLQHWSSPRGFVESCERALPDAARQHLDSGISLSRRRAAEQAASELKLAAADPKLAAVALDHLGLLALDGSCFSRAVAIYDRILDIDATYQGGRGYLLRGLAYFRSGDVSRALDDAEHACRVGNKEGCTASERIRASARRSEP